MSLYTYIAAGTLIVLIVWAVGSYLVINNLEEPAYTVVEQRDGYEIRSYKPYIIAQTTVTGSFDEASESGFRIIADYIFGNNTSRSSIAMTAPVLEAQSESIAMTVPVINTLEESDTRTIAFVLPSQYTLDTLPLPNNNQVEIIAVPEQTIAASRFTWYATANRVATKKQALFDRLIADEVTIIGDTQVARYNPPLSMPLLLRNEILIPIE